MKTSSAIRILESLLLISIAIFTLSAWSQGQTQEQDLQQLKDKLQKLEQEMEELKGQISKVQQASLRSAPPTTVRAEQEAQETPSAPGEQKNKKKGSVDIYGHVMMDSGYEFGQTRSSTSRETSG